MNIGAPNLSKTTSQSRLHQSNSGRASYNNEDIYNVKQTQNEKHLLF